MSNPPKKTRTQPGLGEGDAVPRVDSAEMRKVRSSATDEVPHSSERTPPPAGLAERPRLRDSVRREDPDEPQAASRAEEVFKPKPSVRQQSALRRDSFRQQPSIRDSVAREEGTTESVRLRDSVHREDAPADSVRPRVRDSVRREDPDDSGGAPREEQVSLRKPSAPPVRRGSALSSQWTPEKDTGTRPKPSSTPTPNRSVRPPVTVDEVGATALKIARSTRREGAPKLVASRAIVAKAPIDTRSAFVLSLVDGRNTVDAIVDMAGMPADEVKAILERLARLGLIELP